MTQVDTATAIRPGAAAIVQVCHGSCFVDCRVFGLQQYVTEIGMAPALADLGINAAGFATEAYARSGMGTFA
jgi:hypothetical protein